MLQRAVLGCLTGEIMIGAQIGIPLDTKLAMVTGDLRVDGHPFTGQVATCYNSGEFMPQDERLFKTPGAGRAFCVPMQIGTTDTYGRYF